MVAGLIGFTGAAIVILSNADTTALAAPRWSWGYVAALAAAFVWSTYSLMTRRVKAFPTAAIGGFAWVSGLLSLLCHSLMEPSVDLTGQDWLLIGVMGLGPMGAAFFLWDFELSDTAVVYRRAAVGQRSVSDLAGGLGCRVDCGCRLAGHTGEMSPPGAGTMRP